MQYTTNYNLGKPDGTDAVNPNSRNALNTNMNTIDTQLKANADNITALDTRVDALEVDYVVEKGTTTAQTYSGGTQTWTYEKWNSGKLMAWTEFEYSNVPCTTAWGNIYTSDKINEYFPTMFLTVTYTSMVKASGTSAWLDIGTGRNLELHRLQGIYFCRADATNGINAWVSATVIGTWK